MKTRRRLLLAAALAATTVTVAGGLTWVVFSFVPLRGVVGGPFAAASQTPAAAHQQSRESIPDASWPMFGGSPARTRFVPSGLRPPFRLLYKIRGEGLIEMPPVVAQGKIVVGTHDGLVIATRVEDGTRLWTTNLGRCIASSPAVRQGVVYIGWSGPAPCRAGKGETGGVVALDLQSGMVRWRYRTGNVESSPAIVGNRLFFSAFRNRSESYVYSMRLTKPRTIVWRHRITSKIASSPALVGRTLYVSAYNRQLYSFDGWTGRMRWQTSAFSDDPEARLLLGVRSLVRRKSWTEGGYYSTPTMAYRRAFLGTIDGVFSAFDARSGVPRWSRKLDGPIYGSAAVWKENVYVGTAGGTFYALSAKDGRVLWTHHMPGKILGSPTVTNHRVYIASTARQTVVLDARTGKLYWRFADGHYSPLVVTRGKAFLVGKGRVYAVENAGCPKQCRASDHPRDRQLRNGVGSSRGSAAHKPEGR